MKPSNEAIVPQMPEMASAATSAAASRCSFCSRTTDNELIYGKLCSQGGITVHLFCLLLSSNMEQRGKDDEGIMGFLLEDIAKELKRGRRLTCAYCKKTGATLGCCYPKCRRVFHLPCGMERGSLNQYYDTFRSYCPQHRPNQVIPDGEGLADGENSICGICQEEVDREPNFSVIWAPCCRKNFHKLCLQKFALSAGYFFKCPMCNNKQIFHETMLEFGIYIPERDASWELEPGAFQDLLARYNHCDAQRCLCTQGREFQREGSSWALIMCAICGSHAIHVTCGGLKSHDSHWECPECRNILSGAGYVTPVDGNLVSTDEWRQIAGKGDILSSDAYIIIIDCDDSVLVCQSMTIDNILDQQTADKRWEENEEKNEPEPTVSKALEAMDNGPTINYY